MKFYFYLICIVLCSVTAQATQSENEKKIDSIIRSIPDGDRYESEQISQKIDESLKQLYAIGSPALPILLDRWQPTMNSNQFHVVITAITDDLLDSTIFTHLYKRNASTSDGRISYLNSAILYASIWDGATSPPEEPRRDWGNCPIEFLDILFAHLDDTSTLTFKNDRGNYDFVRGAISRTVDDIEKKCRAKSILLAEQCIKDAMPNNTVKVPVWMLNNVNAAYLVRSALEQSTDGKIILNMNITLTGSSASKLLREWYKTNRSELIWNRNHRGFIMRKK